MPSFDSTIGKKNFMSTPMRELDVPDESNRMPREFEIKGAQTWNMQQEEGHMSDEDIAELEHKIRAEREAKRTGRERLSDGAKKRIEMLIGMTRTTHNVDVLGTTFVFQSLKAKEMREAITAAVAFDQTVQSPFEIRKQFLARSISQIAGVDFAQFIGSNSLEAKLMFVEEMDDALLNKLYDEYLILAKKARDKFEVKTEEDVKEIIEDLKK